MGPRVAAIALLLLGCTTRGRLIDGGTIPSAADATIASSAPDAGASTRAGHDPALVGSWSSGDDGDLETVSFYDDGWGDWYEFEQSRPLEHARFRWHTDAGILYVDSTRVIRYRIAKGSRLKLSTPPVERSRASEYTKD